MKLLVFAHRNEALPFIEGMKPYQGVLSNIYKNEDTYLLITGEGPDNAQTKTAALIAYLLGQNISIEKVINLGVAGSLSEQIQIGDIYSIRSFYAEKLQGTPDFTSFQSDDNDSRTDCITSAQRVLSDNYAKTLAPMASIVDREAWGIARACQLFNLPFYSYKYISDRAGNQTQCFDVRKDSVLYATQLFEHYNNLSQSQATDINKLWDEIKPHLVDFYFTASTRSQAKKLITALINKGSSVDKIITQLNLEKLITEIPHPKKRAVKLIHELRLLTNPLEKKIENLLYEASKDLSYGKNKVYFDPDLEKNEIQLHSTITSKEDVDKLISNLLQFQYDEVEKVFNGDIEL